MYNADQMSELNKLKDIIFKDIRSVNTRGVIAPNELEPLYKMVCMLEKMDKTEKIQNDLEEYSGRRSMSGMMRGSYSRDHQNRTTGVGGAGSMPYYDTDHMYSGHSIHDRIIDKIESLLPETNNEYERQIVNEYITRASQRN